MPLHKATILFLGAFSGFRYSPRLRRGSNMRSIRGAVAVVTPSAGYVLSYYPETLAKPLSGFSNICRDFSPDGGVQCMSPPGLETLTYWSS